MTSCLRGETSGFLQWTLLISNFLKESTLLAFPITLTGWKARPAVCRLPSAVYLPSTIHRAVALRHPHSFIRSPIFVDGHPHRLPSNRRPPSNSAVCRLRSAVQSRSAVCRPRSTYRPPSSKKNTPAPIARECQVSKISDRIRRTLSQWVSLSPLHCYKALPVARRPSSAFQHPSALLSSVVRRVPRSFAATC